jgi:hypothetical protein
MGITHTVTLVILITPVTPVTPVTPPVLTRVSSLLKARTQNAVLVASVAKVLLTPITPVTLRLTQPLTGITKVRVTGKVLHPHNPVTLPVTL